MRSLTLKLTLAFLLVGLTGALLVAVLIRYQTRAAFDQFLLNREQQALAESLVEYYQENGSWAGAAAYWRDQWGRQERVFEGDREIRREQMGFTLVGADRRVIYSTLPGKVDQSISSRKLEQSISLESGGETVGWLVLASGPRQWVRNSPEERFLSNVNRVAIASALVAVALALTIGGLLAFTMTRSLRELTEATVEIAGGRLGRQVKVRSQDEIGELAASFNKMSQDLERATQARRQMTADIAHDLRSPLSVISGYAEALSDGKLPGTPEVYTILHQETQHLSRLVEDLRTLSLADAGELPLALQPAQPRLLLERVAARHAIAAGQQNITLRVDAEQDLPPVTVDAERMAQVFDNLVLNAFRYTPGGGEVVLAAQVEYGKVVFQVRDSGRGIAPEDLPHIFDRFYKGDKARQQSGESGLGLAIARSIVKAHGGKIEVESREGEGARFTILLMGG